MCVREINDNRPVMKYRLKHVIEFTVLRGVVGIVRFLPHRVALFIGWLIAGITFHVFRFRVRTACDRIRGVFMNRFSGREIHRIAWLSMRNVGLNTVEMPRVARMNVDWLTSTTDCREAMEVLKRQADTGKGAIIAVPHAGNWEMAAITCRRHGLPIFIIAAAQKNPLTNRIFCDLRKQTGIDTVERGSGTMRAVMTKLKRGGMLAILPDVRLRDEGIPVPFLGGTANLGKGMALFARHTGAPIIPCIVSRHGWTNHRIRVCDRIVPDESLSKEEDIIRMTVAVMRVLEEAILEDPAQWFWYNKRWVLDPL